MARPAPQSRPPNPRSAPALPVPLGDGPDVDAGLAEIEALAAFLDARYRIPGTGVRFGLDAILGVVPVVGDAAAMLPSLYLVWRARRLGVPPGLVLRMLGNVGLDTVVGSIPIAGGLFDVFFKANRRNHALIRRHLARRADAAH